MEEESFLDSELLTLNEKKRPTAITVLCILGIFGAVVSVPIIFSKLAGRIGGWYPPFLAISSINGIICMVGFWKMKKWAVYLYISFFIAAELIMMSMGVFKILSLLMPTIVIGILLNFINKMD